MSKVQGVRKPSCDEQQLIPKQHSQTLYSQNQFHKQKQHISSHPDEKYDKINSKLILYEKMFKGFEQKIKALEKNVKYYDKVMISQKNNENATKEEQSKKDISQQILQENRNKVNLSFKINSENQIQQNALKSIEEQLQSIHAKFQSQASLFQEKFEKHDEAILKLKNQTCQISSLKNQIETMFNVNDAMQVSITTLQDNVIKITKQINEGQSNFQLQSDRKYIFGSQSSRDKQDKFNLEITSEINNLYQLVKQCLLKCSPSNQLQQQQISEKGVLSSSLRCTSNTLTNSKEIKAIEKKVTENFHIGTRSPTFQQDESRDELVQKEEQQSIILNKYKSIETKDTDQKMIITKQKILSHLEEKKQQDQIFCIQQKELEKSVKKQQNSDILSIEQALSKNCSNQSKYNSSCGVSSRNKASYHEKISRSMFSGNKGKQNSLIFQQIKDERPQCDLQQQYQQNQLSLNNSAHSSPNFKANKQESISPKSKINKQYSSSNFASPSLQKVNQQYNTIDNGHMSHLNRNNENRTGSLQVVNQQQINTVKTDQEQWEIRKYAKNDSIQIKKPYQGKQKSNSICLSRTQLQKQIEDSQKLSQQGQHYIQGLVDRYGQKLDEVIADQKYQTAHFKLQTFESEKKDFSERKNAQYNSLNFSYYNPVSRSKNASQHQDNSSQIRQNKNNNSMMMAPEKYLSEDPYQPNNSFSQTGGDNIQKKLLQPQNVLKSDEFQISRKNSINSCKSSGNNNNIFSNNSQNLAHIIQQSIQPLSVKSAKQSMIIEQKKRQIDDEIEKRLKQEEMKRKQVLEELEQINQSYTSVRQYSSQSSQQQPPPNVQMRNNNNRTQTQSLNNSTQFSESKRLSFSLQQQQQNDQNYHSCNPYNSQLMANRRNSKNTSAEINNYGTDQSSFSHYQYQNNNEGGSGGYRLEKRNSISCHQNKQTDSIYNKIE